jgi:hypothetical protein
MLKTTSVKTAFIFGPYAQNEEADTVNVFIVGPATLTLDGIKDIEDRFSKKISVMLMDENEFRTKRETNDAELEKLLSGEKIILMGKL